MWKYRVAGKSQLSIKTWETDICCAVTQKKRWSVEAKFHKTHAPITAHADAVAILVPRATRFHVPLRVTISRFAVHVTKRNEHSGNENDGVVYNTSNHRLRSFREHTPRFIHLVRIEFRKNEEQKEKAKCHQRPSRHITKLKRPHIPHHPQTRAHSLLSRQYKTQIQEDPVHVFHEIKKRVKNETKI